MHRKAEMGVGTLIIFISLLLVAAVAAGVLIQTAGSLQQKALSTGAQATTQISTNAVALEVSATDGQLGQTLDNLTMVMKLAPGSDPIQLSAVSLSLNTANTSQSLNYSGNTYGDTSGFGINYIQNGANGVTGVLVRGDVIEVNMQSTRTLVEGEEVRIGFVPKTGTATNLLFDMPDVINTQRVYLYP